MVLRAFAPGVRAELPFLMPTVAGTVRQGALSTFVYSHLAGTTRSVEELTAGSEGLAKEIGAALAAIHDLPQALVSNADLPSYTPNEFRQRRLNELDQAATTGKIPPVLLRRWEHALEDVSLWRFNPCVVHGDLHEDNLLVEGERVTAVTGWTDLRIGDPADDMAWLVASNEQSFVDSVLRHYTSSRRDAPDAHLLRRAALSAEFALAQYLVKGLAAGDQAMIAEAEEMLASLAEDITEHGGQPISVEPLPQTVPAVHVEPVPQDDPARTTGMPSAALAAEQISGLSGTPSADAMPSVHVTPIPINPIPAPPSQESGDPGNADRGAPAETSGEDDATQGADGDSGTAHAADGENRITPPAALSADDTSTAALKIVDATKSH
jgi:macrolide phosphotransferase